MKLNHQIKQTTFLKVSRVISFDTRKHGKKLCDLQSFQIKKNIEILVNLSYTHSSKGRNKRNVSFFWPEWI